MSEELINGEPGVQRLPTIEVSWDAEAQRAHIAFKVSDFHTWEFVIALLDMAKRAAEHNHRMALLSMAQQAGAEQAQNEMIRRSLRGR